MAVRDLDRGGADDPESAIYWARKQRQMSQVQERATKQRKEEAERDQQERAVMGYSAWKEKQAEILRLKALEQVDDDARDVRSDRQRREESREQRRLERTHLREREADEAERRTQEWQQDEHERRQRREDEREDWSRHWERREASRAELGVRRERLTALRHAREEEAVLGKSLREARQQLAEEAETVAASEWSSLLTLRTKEKERRLLRLARLHAALPVPPGEDESLLQGQDELHLREAQRLRRREAALHGRVAEEETDAKSTAQWYQDRRFDRQDRTRRAIKTIDPPPPAVLKD